MEEKRGRGRPKGEITYLEKRERAKLATQRRREEKKKQKEMEETRNQVMERRGLIKYKGQWHTEEEFKKLCAENGKKASRANTAHFGVLGGNINRKPLGPLQTSTRNEGLKLRREEESKRAQERRCLEGEAMLTISMAWMCGVIAYW